MPSNQTVCRLLVGNELRRARDAAGHKQDVAADHIGAKLSKISRLELGQTRVTVAEVKMLLEFYGADPAHIDVMLSLARDCNQRGRWDGHRAAHREWFRMLVDLEAGAEQIRQAQPEIVPGILQVEPYIRTIYAQSRRCRTPAEIDDRVQARLERQEIFAKAEPPRMAFVLQESCLHRQVGDPEVMRLQLSHLVEVAAMPNVILQVLPFDAKTYASGITRHFTILTIGTSGLASPLDFVYIESHDDARYLDDKAAVRGYMDIWDGLTAAALGPVESVELIKVVAARRY